MLLGRLQDEVAERRRFNRERRAARARLPQAFVRREKKDPVADDRPSEAESKLVLLELGGTAVSKTLRAESVSF